MHHSTCEVNPTVGSSHDLMSALQNDPIVCQAIDLLETHMFCRDGTLTSPKEAQAYLRLKLISEPAEVFGAIFLDNHHHVIAWELLFRGTIDTCPVHKRVVLQRALAYNCAAVILAHQHPSGCTDPSPADRHIKKELVELLAHIDVRVIDHVIVGQGEPFSFANAGHL